MKVVLFLSFIHLAAFSSFGSECVLKNPVPLPGDFLSRGVHFKKITVDQTPVFTVSSRYNPAEDTLNLDLFPVMYNSVKTGYVGASIEVQNKLESVGASNEYDGDIELSGQTQTRGNNVLYLFTSVSHLMNASGQSTGSTTTQTAIVVSNGKLVSVQLHFPIYTVWKHGTDGIYYVKFTGKYQDLCVTSIL